MLFRAVHDDSSYSLTLRERSVSITRDEGITVASDLAGRLYSYFRNGVMSRRALNGRLIQKWHDDEVANRRWLEPAEASTVVDEAATFVGGGLEAMDSPGWKWVGEAPDPARLHELRRLLGLSVAFDAATAEIDAARFDEVYDPVGILPPDHYLSLVLQATQGCSFDSCAFCDLYDRPFRVRTPDEFRSHIEAVRNYFGPGLSLRDRSVFLGAANALAVPMQRLVAFFEEIQRGLGWPSRGVHSFVDGFTGERKTASDYRTLARLGLKRVYVGLESGHDPLLELVSKPARAAQVVETVSRVREAGVHVGVIVIVGLGGDRFSEGHVTDTIRTLNAMDLGHGDLVFLSDMVPIPGTAYPRLAAEHEMRALDPGELREERRRILSGLVFRGVAPRVAGYDIREFIY
jgi:hypothetical protein